MAEVLHDAVVQVTQVPSKFDSIGFPGADKQTTDFYPVGTRAIQLYDAAVENYFLTTFGRNQRRIVCECERSNEPSMVQVLHISNGDTLNEKLKTADNRLDTLKRFGRLVLLERGRIAGVGRYDELVGSSAAFRRMVRPREFRVPVGSTLLAAMEANALPVNAACRAGVCGSCKTRILEGDYTTTSTMTLSEEEVAQGYVLACSCQLQGDVTLA